jgi:hypothetical protein
MVPGRVYLHDVSMIVIGVEGAHQKEEDHLTTTWHVRCPYSINCHNNLPGAYFFATRRAFDRQA